MRTSTQENPIRVVLTIGMALFCLCMSSAGAADAASPRETAQTILSETGVQGGLIVHVGCGDGRLTAALRADDRYWVHGLDRDARNVEQTRAHIRSLRLYGQVSVDRLRDNRLPYIDNIVNLLVVEDPSGIAEDEILRVLSPEGCAYINRDGEWTQLIKPRPDEIDEWTHYLHDAGGNPVAHDTVVGPPRRLQWVGAPRWSRHHDHMSSMSALVTTGGRIFHIMDEGPDASIELPPDRSLIAQDAFNGKILWKRPIAKWHTHLWPLKSGPAQLPRRLVAQDDTVYVTLGIDAPVSALEASTGKTLREYEGTRGAEEIILSDGVLYVLVNPTPREQVYANIQEVRRGKNDKFWDENPRKIVALRADSGERLWEEESKVLPIAFAADSRGLYIHNAERILCLSRDKGEELWRSEPLPRAEEIKSFFAPTLIVHKDVVLFAGGERAGEQTGTWYTDGIDTMTALSAETGKTLWQAYHPPSGYRSPEDILVLDDLVWTGETTSGRVIGMMRGRDLHTGEVLNEFVPDVETYWFHHRCYRSKATDRYLLTARVGTEFIDPVNKHWEIHNWVRGACAYGVMPANGLLYAGPHPCACYLESKLRGFNVVAPESTAPRLPESVSSAERFERGPAFGKVEGTASAKVGTNDWPTYRHDPARSGFTKTRLAADLEPAWKTEIGGKLTSIVSANGKVFVATVEDHTLHALDAASGEPLWRYTAGGRVDSPPTVHKGRVLFGSADGWVYCLRVSDGALVWRFLAAPMDQRTFAFEQIESVWPVHGSVLVKDDVLYCVSGRSMFLDGGLRLWRIDPLAARLLSETVLDDKEAATGKDIQDFISWLNMPVTMPDILSTDGRHVYMRSQPFGLDGKRLPLTEMPRAKVLDRGTPPISQDPEFAHLFCPTGFLEDSWWHRSYWLYGSAFTSGWNGYPQAGKTAPAGKILVFDDENVYAFGRKPKYYRWTTQLEHQLYAAKKLPKQITTTDRKGNGRTYKQIEHLWKETIPFWVRSMVLADETLFIAGPPDYVDEEEVLKRLNDPEILKSLDAQKEAIRGERGALLRAVSIENGETLSEYRLDFPPVWDGMIAAQGQLLVADLAGNITCFRKEN